VHSLEKKFDVILINGLPWVNCLKQSLAAASQTGVLILDDSQRDENQKAIEAAHSHGYLSLEFEGMKPTHFDGDRTTIIYRPDRHCLGI
jgi:hypothetical protein